MRRYLRSATLLRMRSVSLTTRPRSLAFSSSSDKTPSECSSSVSSSPRSDDSSRHSSLSTNFCLLSGGYAGPMANPLTGSRTRPQSSHSPEWIESGANLRPKLATHGTQPRFLRGPMTKCRKYFAPPCRIAPVPFVFGSCSTNPSKEPRDEHARQQHHRRSRTDDRRDRLRDRSLRALIPFRR